MYPAIIRFCVSNIDGRVVSNIVSWCTVQIVSDKLLVSKGCKVTLFIVKS